MAKRTVPTTNMRPTKKAKPVTSEQADLVEDADDLSFISDGQDEVSNSLEEKLITSATQSVGIQDKPGDSGDDDHDDDGNNDNDQQRGMSPSKGKRTQKDADPSASVKDLPKTPRVYALKECCGVAVNTYGVVTKIYTISLADAFPTQQRSLTRMKNVLRHAGAFPTAVNMYQIKDVSKFVLRRPGATVTTSGIPSKTVIFSLSGILTFSALDRNDSMRSKQICVVPFTDGFAKVLAVIGTMFKSKYVFFNTTRDGLTFSTNTFLDPGRTDPTAFKPILYKNSEVPIYDGRARTFFWSKYTELPEVNPSSLVDGMACTVLFTISYYNTTNSRPIINRSAVRLTASLNIQSVVIMENGDPRFDSEQIGDKDLDFTDIDTSDKTVLEHAINYNELVLAPIAEENPEEECI